MLYYIKLVIYEAVCIVPKPLTLYTRLLHMRKQNKAEKWYDLYEKQRSKFDSFADFAKWYNTVRYHESLDTKPYLQTLGDALWSRLPDESKLNVFFKHMEAGL